MQKLELKRCTLQIKALTLSEGIIMTHLIVEEMYSVLVQLQGQSLEKWNVIGHHLQHKHMFNITVIVKTGAHTGSRKIAKTNNKPILFILQQITVLMHMTLTASTDCPLVLKSFQKTLWYQQNVMSVCNSFTSENYQKTCEHASHTPLWPVGMLAV